MGRQVERGRRALPDETTLLRFANEDLRALLVSLGASVDSCVEQLERYRLLLQAETAKWNISKYRKPHEIILCHFVDSLQALRYPGTQGAREAIDVGTGAGLPGVPCAIVRTDWQITLMDSRKKQCDFLGQVVREILPGRARILMDRGEVAAHCPSERGRYDLVLARAVAPLPSLLEMTLPFLLPGGLLLAHRGATWREDLAASRAALDVLHGEFLESLLYRLRGHDADRAVLAFRLCSPPLGRYPRSPARVRRDPLR